MGFVWGYRPYFLFLKKKNKKEGKYPKVFSKYVANPSNNSVETKVGLGWERQFLVEGESIIQ